MRRSVQLIGSMLLVIVVLLATRIEGWSMPNQRADRQTVPPSYQTYLPLVTNNYVAPAPLWRFGVGVSRGAITDYDSPDLIRLRLGWYTNWTASPNAAEPYGMTYVPVVRVKQWKVQSDGSWTTCCVDCPYAQQNNQYVYTVSPDLATIAAMASARPGLTWIIGNEIERVDWGNGYCGRQDEMLPEVYAEAYHDIRQAILNADPTAKTAIGGVIQFTPLRQQYLDRVWDAYQTQYGGPMPVDVWNVHAFVLQEKKGDWGADIPAGIDATQGMLYSVADNKDFSIAWGHILNMRTWMKAKGEQDKPLIISEYGVNMPWFSFEEVRDNFMYPSFDHFLNQSDVALGYPADDYHLVQQWLWYSLDDDRGYFNGNLMYSGQEPTPKGISLLGVYWQDYVQSLPLATRPPYALAPSSESSAFSTAPSGAHIVGAWGAQSDSQTCNGSSVRLVFVAPSPSGAALGNAAEAGEILGEQVACLDGDTRQ